MGTAAYLCLHQARLVQIPLLITVSEDPHLVSRGVGVIALCAPFALMALVSLECWQLRASDRQCEENPAMAEAVQQVMTAAFAWMATPPR